MMKKEERSESAGFGRVRKTTKTLPSHMRIDESEMK